MSSQSGIVFWFVCAKQDTLTYRAQKSLKKLDTNFQLAFYLQKRNKTLFGFIILAIFQTNRNKNMERVLFTILLSQDSMIGTTLLDLYLTLSSKLGSLQSRLLSELKEGAFCSISIEPLHQSTSQHTSIVEINLLFYYLFIYLMKYCQDQFPKQYFIHILHQSSYFFCDHYNW